MLSPLAGCNATQERSGARGTVGYTVTPPAGWKDVTRAVERETGAAFDVAYAGPTQDGSRTTLNVARSDAGRDPSLPRLVAEGRREVAELAGRKLRFSRPSPVRVGGEPALRYDFASGGKRVRQVGVVRDGGFYVVTLTATEATFPRALGRLDGVLRTWRWE